MVDFSMQIRKGEWILRFTIIQIYCLALCSYQVCRDHAICIYGKCPYNRLFGQMIQNPNAGLPTKG